MQISINRDLFQNGAIIIKSDFAELKTKVYSFNQYNFQDEYTKAIKDTLQSILKKLIKQRINNYTYAKQTATSSEQLEFLTHKCEQFQKLEQKASIADSIHRLFVLASFYQEQILPKLQNLMPSKTSKYFEKYNATYLYLVTYVGKLIQENKDEQLFQ